MEEKIKVNIQKSVFEILNKDMELFGFYKKNGSLNQNLFFTTLISNYYTDYNDKKNHTFNLISDHLIKSKKITDKSVYFLALEITDKIDDYILDLTNERFDKSIAIKPTKNTIKVFNYINDYLVPNTGISSFYRSLFTSYSKLPQNEREKIIFKNVFELISKAIKENKKIFFTLIKNNEVSPYKLSSSKEELFNYLLAVNNNKIFTYRLSKIKDITILNQQATISEKQKSLLDKMIELGPQYPIYEEDLDEIIVKLTTKGIELYKSIYLHRPKISKIENDLYYFNCSYQQIMQYFSRFGKHAIIISPKSLRDNIYKYYSDGYYAYKKYIVDEKK